MPRTSEGFWRCVHAMQSRRIPEGATCCIGKCGQPATHVLISVQGRNYVCQPHAERGLALGYEMFEGKPGSPTHLPERKKT